MIHAKVCGFFFVNLFLRRKRLYKKKDYIRIFLLTPTYYSIKDHTERATTSIILQPKIQTIIIVFYELVKFYYIWRERNEKRHNNTSKPVDHPAKLIDKMIMNMITSLGYFLTPKLHGLMRRWLSSQSI